VPSAPEGPPLQWHHHSSHGAHVRGLLLGAPHKQPAAYARKVLLNWHLLKHPSPDGLPRHASRVIALEPHAGPILTGRALGVP
jgi:hypothetical protein